MNDEMKGKSGKVKVMYVRSEEASDSLRGNPRTGKGGRSTSKSAGSRDDGRRRGPWSDKTSREERREPSSPWRTVSRPAGEEMAPATGHDGFGAKGFVDPETLRRQRTEETRIYGENACQALFLNRPESIVRAWFVQEVTPRFKEALRWMAANRKAYHVVNEVELAKASGTDHHGGVCFLIKKRNGISATQWLTNAGERDCVLALEDIGNPHNLGAIVRSCAHFGVKGVVVSDAALLESGAAVRTAEGGAEHVKAINAENFAETLNLFRRAGYQIVTTSSHRGTPLFSAKLPAKTVLVIGQERDGLSDAVFANSDLRVAINGTGQVESLNVSVATGILLGEWYRQNQE